MRVALLSHNARAADAIGNQVALKLAFFLERGADVRVLVESDQRLHPAVRPHCLVVGVPEPRGEGWRFLSSADLVVVEYGQYYRLLDLLPLLAGGRGRVLFDYHGVTPPELWSAHNREAVEAGVRRRGLVWCADAALAHSRFTADELRAATGFPPERLCVLGDGVDRDHFRPGEAARPLRDQLRLGDATLLLFVGRLAPNKRVPVLVEALARLRDLSPAVHAAVIGDTGDLYQAEARRCRERAADLGVADRLHLLGPVEDGLLRDAYRSADLLVMPSRHEGFCVPVLEAMACGLPVVAARAGALPETVGGAGLTFTPDDPDDLAGQVRRVLGGRSQKPEVRSQKSEGEPTDSSGSLRVAVVGFRYGTDIVGGAERSLRTIAETLHAAGHRVEVFTTCTRGESNWSNELPEGTVTLGGIPVHRYRIDPHDRGRHLEAVRAVLQAEGEVSAEAEREYLEHSIHSARLVEALDRRYRDFDAIIVGPYLFGLTLDVARAFPEKTLLLPCFHDEPVARLTVWREAYGWVGGLLYHSPEEQQFAETRLGLNHPGAACVGAWFDTECSGQAVQAAALVERGRPYLIYCGRYSAQKGFPELLDFANRYRAEHPERFAFVFLGRGEVPVPRQPGFFDLGFVDEALKPGLLAGAAALVQLSRYESLSYAALEAWAQGTPVIADGRCEVLAGHLRRCGGGAAVETYEDFSRALDDLWEHPERWQGLGASGREYVRKHHGGRGPFTERLVAAVRGLTVPLADKMRARGLERAAGLDRARWRERFGELVENVLHAEPRPHEPRLEVRPRQAARSVPAGSGTALVPVRVVNRGTHAVLAAGPGRWALRCRVVEESGHSQDGPEAELPGLLMPGRAAAAAVPVPVPDRPGRYRVAFRAEPVRGVPAPVGKPVEGWLDLTVEGAEAGRNSSCCAPLLDAAQAALVQAYRVQKLPADYTDVTEGLFASWKRGVKQKLLNNFKHAYVDVLSRQQSAFNRFVLTALEELAECCAVLDHAAPGAGAGDAGAADRVVALFHDLARRLAESEQRCATLEERLARLESRLEPREGVELTQPARE